MIYLIPGCHFDILEDPDLGILECTVEDCLCIVLTTKEIEKLSSDVVVLGRNLRGYSTGCYCLPAEKLEFDLHDELAKTLLLVLNNFKKSELFLFNFTSI